MELVCIDELKFSTSSLFYNFYKYIPHSIDHQHPHVEWAHPRDEWQYQARQYSMVMVQCRQPKICIRSLCRLELFLIAKRFPSNISTILLSDFTELY